MDTKRCFLFLSCCGRHVRSSFVVDENPMMTTREKAPIHPSLPVESPLPRVTHHKHNDVEKSGDNWIFIIFFIDWTSLTQKRPSRHPWPVSRQAGMPLRRSSHLATKK